MTTSNPALDPVVLDALLTGRAVPYSRPGTLSAIAKTPVTDALQITVNGLHSDEQGDLRVHGGVEKAIHHYPREHYETWRQELGDNALLAAPGAFGENFSTRGWTEHNVCIGDRIRAGTALLEVSQGRMPCWKLNDRFGVRDMALRVQQTGRTGWYYRVLEPGIVQSQQALVLQARPYPQWPLARLTAVLFSQNVELPMLSECLALPLGSSWRRTLEKRVEKRQVEDWSPRLLGPT